MRRLCAPRASGAGELLGRQQDPSNEEKRFEQSKRGACCEDFMHACCVHAHIQDLETRKKTLAEA